MLLLITELALTPGRFTTAVIIRVFNTATNRLYYNTFIAVFPLPALSAHPVPVRFVTLVVTELVVTRYTGRRAVRTVEVRITHHLVPELQSPAAERRGGVPLVL